MLKRSRINGSINASIPLKALPLLALVRRPFDKIVAARCEYKPWKSLGVLRLTSHEMVLGLRPSSLAMLRIDVLSVCHFSI